MQTLTFTTLSILSVAAILLGASMVLDMIISAPIHDYARWYGGWAMLTAGLILFLFNRWAYNR